MSYDVVSLFTNIPLEETIDIAVKLILENSPESKVSQVDLKKLFSFATSQTHFLFNGAFYDQIDGVAMGSPLAPTLANLFLGHHENNWLSDYQGSSPLFYKRYVDDIIAMFDNESDSLQFLNYLNTKHLNIKFTIEKECDKHLSFFLMFYLIIQVLNL